MKTPKQCLAIGVALTVLIATADHVLAQTRLSLYGGHAYFGGYKYSEIDFDYHSGSTIGLLLGNELSSNVAIAMMIRHSAASESGADYSDRWGEEVSIKSARSSETSCGVVISVLSRSFNTSETKVTPRLEFGSVLQHVYNDRVVVDEYRLWSEIERATALAGYLAAGIGFPLGGQSASWTFDIIASYTVPWVLFPNRDVYRNVTTIHAGITVRFGH